MTPRAALRAIVAAGAVALAAAPIAGAWPIARWSADYRGGNVSYRADLKRVPDGRACVVYGYLGVARWIGSGRAPRAFPTGNVPGWSSVRVRKWHTNGCSRSPVARGRLAVGRLSPGAYSAWVISARRAPASAVRVHRSFRLLRVR